MYVLDAKHNLTKALPAAGASASTTSIDLGSSAEGRECLSAEVILEFGAPALPALVDAKTCILTVEDSADDSSFAAVAALATQTQTGASGAGAAAASRKVRLPPNVRRYLRVSAAVLAAGGDNTGKSFFAKLYT